jgi:UDP-glucuronate decarboxylase
LIDEIIRPELEGLKKLAGEFRSKRVVITGGAGFIGSWLCDSFASTGASVCAIDNLSTGVMENIDHLVGANGFTFKALDITSSELVPEKPDLILHFASRASPDEYQMHPIETLVANSHGTRNMLELARKNDARVVYASTSEVYGDAEVIPTPETYWGKVNPNGPRSCYDEGKRYGEAICVAYRRQHDVDARIVRIFNTYGPRMRSDGEYGRSISRFIHQALTGQNITVFGDGSQTRSFCYVTDTVTGILKIASNSAAKGEVVNIGNPREISIVDLAHKVKKLAGSRSNIVYRPLPVDDPRRRCPDVSKARRMLDWDPKFDLEDGLTRTIRWFRTELQRKA